MFRLFVLIRGAHYILGVDANECSLIMSDFSIK
jgi:hypothetical protein